MENVNIATEAVKSAANQQNWCYSQKVQATPVKLSVENGANQSFLMAPVDFNIQPYKFVTPLRVEISESEKQLQTSRLMAFGNSMSATGWSY
jgi:hypothetical protein